MENYNEMAINFLNDHNATMTIEYREQVSNPFGYFTGVHNAYDVTIERNGDSFTVDFKASLNDTKNHIEPTEYDVLACLEKYGYADYEEFCMENGCFGSKDSIKLYKAVMNEYNNVIRLFDDCIEELREIA